MIRIFLLIFLIMPTVANAQLPTDPAGVTLSVFDKEIAAIVTASMKATSDLGVITWSLWAAFAFFLGFKTVALYMLKGLNTLDVLFAVLAIFVSLILMNSYDFLTTAIWYAFDAVGFAIQETALGNTDPYFMAIYVHEAFDLVDLDSVGYLDAIGTILWYALFVVLGAILQIMMYIGSSWAMWGYSLAKLVGFFFVPFFLLQFTRNIFDGWFKLFIGFVIYNMLIRVVMVLFCVFIKVTMGHPTSKIVMPADSSPEIITLIVFMVTGILLTISVSGFAAIIAGGFTSPSAAYASVSRFTSGMFK